MEPTTVSLLVAISALAGTLYQGYLNYKNTSKKNEAEASKAFAEADHIQIESATTIILQMRIQLDRQATEIKELQNEIQLLKSQEKIHLLEKIRLEEVIQKLTEENNDLRKMVEENKVSYTDKIEDLNNQIKTLKLGISQNFK